MINLILSHFLSCVILELKMKLDELSVFFPAYNEEGNIKKTVQSALKVLPSVAKKYEIIIVNDGSKDKTGAIADRLAKEISQVKVINHPQNCGYGEALKSGYYNAQYGWIACTDADGQFDFSEITKLLEKAKDCEVVIGYRINRQDSLLRKFNGWGWTVLVNLLFNLNVRDVDCSFKLVKREVIKKIPRLESTRGGMISPELLAKAKKAGFKIGEVGVHHYPRGTGGQTGANLRVIFQSFIDLFKLWKILRKK